MKAVLLCLAALTGCAGRAAPTGFQVLEDGAIRPVITLAGVDQVLQGVDKDDDYAKATVARADKELAALPRKGAKQTALQSAGFLEKELAKLEQLAKAKGEDIGRPSIPSWAPGP